MRAARGVPGQLDPGPSTRQHRPPYPARWSHAQQLDLACTEPDELEVATLPV